MNHLKPNTLVYVNLTATEGYAYVGEVMSYPIPNAPEFTIMVRRVPDHPGTLVELPVSVVKPLTVKPKHVHYARVEGPGSFPRDMLRYDCAAPVNFELTEDYPGYVSDESDLVGLWIASARATRHGPVWTEARWESFRWQIVETKTLKLEGSVS